MSAVSRNPALFQKATLITQEKGFAQEDVDRKLQKTPVPLPQEAEIRGQKGTKGESCKIC